jgi:hypothetical protein
MENLPDAPENAIYKDAKVQEAWKAMFEDSDLDAHQINYVRNKTMRKVEGMKWGHPMDKDLFRKLWAWIDGGMEIWDGEGGWDG